MKKIFALISAFFMLFFCNAKAAYTGSDINNIAGFSFEWAEKNIAPLANPDSVASDYHIMALKRAGKAFDYGKYISVTDAKTPKTVQDGQRMIMANTAAGGVLDDDIISQYTYGKEFTNTQDIATSLIAILSGEYAVKSDTTDINRLAVQLLEKQNSDGSFDSDILTTAKSMIALSFLSGKCYVVKGEEIGERYRYDVNTAILRGVNYLQNNKNQDCGYGNVLNTAFVVMALDSAGVDADNDPGFSDGEKSTLSALLENCEADGSFGGDKDSTAVALCAIVSHLRAMQGNSAFFTLRTEDMPYNPDDYIEDINHSGEGLKIETQDEIEVSFATQKLIDTSEPPYTLESYSPVESEPYTGQRRTGKNLIVIIVVIVFVIITAVALAIVSYFVYIRPKKNFHCKKSEEDEGDSENKSDTRK